MTLFTCSLPISENINSPLLFVLYFWTSKVRAKKLLFGFFWWSKPARLVPAQLLPPFKIVIEEGNAKCDCLSFKSCTSENHRNIFHHTDQYRNRSAFNSVRKQKKGKTKYKHDLCFAFVFNANELDPLEKPFHKLGLRVPSGFLNTRIQ